jgi:hypothetical protein
MYMIYGLKFDLPLTPPDIDYSAGLLVILT